jgi:hypothetical protein
MGAAADVKKASSYFFEKTSQKTFFKKAPLSSRPSHARCTPRLTIPLAIWKPLRA